MAYNATVIDEDDNGARGTFVAEVEKINGKLQMLSANWVKTYRYENKRFVEDVPELNAKKGDSIFHTYILSQHQKSRFTIYLDDCERYKKLLSGLDIPESYFEIDSWQSNPPTTSERYNGS